MDDDDNKIEPLNIMLQETRAFIKNQDGEIKWMYLLIDDYELLRKIMIFGMKSTVV